MKDWHRIYRTLILTASALSMLCAWVLYAGGYPVAAMACVVTAMGGVLADQIMERRGL